MWLEECIRQLLGTMRAFHRVDKNGAQGWGVLPNAVVLLCVFNYLSILRKKFSFKSHYFHLASHDSRKLAKRNVHLSLEAMI